jgi:hypothetical protein
VDDRWRIRRVNFAFAIGNSGAADDSDDIKIGVSGKQTNTFIAGIENAKVTGAAV